MPMPLWWGHVNKRVFNPLTLAQGKSPVLTHVGRASGRTYHTPLDAFPIPGGYLFILVYGSRSDWVRNILAAGSARLLVDGKEVELTAPRVVGRDEALESLPVRSRRPVRVLRITEFLRMDLAAG